MNDLRDALVTTAAVADDSQDDLVNAIRNIYEEIKSDDDGDDYVERYYVDLHDMQTARQHAEQYRDKLAGTCVTVEQRNTRIVFTLNNPPPMI